MEFYIEGLAYDSSITAQVTMAKFKCWTVLHLLLLIALPATVAAQPSPELGLPILRTYLPRDVGFSKQIWNILQDRRGVLYFAAGQGIFEYDGANWRKIKVASNVVRSLAQDGDGKIWMGVNGSFGTLEADRHGSMEYLPLTEKIPVEDRDFTDV